MLAGGVELGGPLESLAPPWVSSVWPEVAPVGAEAFTELAPPVVCSPS